MPRIVFTPQLQRFVDAPELRCDGDTVRAALDSAFVAHPNLRAYVLDDQGHLRKHVAVFVDGEMLRDRHSLADPLQPDSEIYVLQALSGG